MKSPNDYITENEIPTENKSKDEPYEPEQVDKYSDDHSCDTSEVATQISNTSADEDS